MSFNDPSGDRLREWLGIDRAAFYDVRRVAILPLGFCYPGRDAKGGDLPPRAECAPLWQARVARHMGGVDLCLLVGGYAQRWHLGNRVKKTLTETVAAWREYLPRYLPLPHPSWRNNGWLTRNPWFGDELLPYLRREVSLRVGASCARQAVTPPGIEP
jgi:uracil-DNA glycosylase